MRVHLQNDRYIYDILFGTAHLICKAVDVVPDLAKVGEFPARNLVREHRVGFSSVINVVETQLEWTSGHNTIATGEKIQSDNRLEHGGFTSGLGAKHCNSRQIDVLVKTDISQFILHATTHVSK